MKPTFGRRRPAALLERKRIEAAPASGNDAAYDWRRIGRYARNGALALLIAAKLAVAAMHFAALDKSYSFSQYAPPMAAMAALVIFILGALWLLGVKPTDRD
ncbi:hypothetical protein [Rhizobium chutanense]|uniref:Uncharacterized protein n=1 Tax=Rhizobium chutanense TaxID=2035448 RepID=A0A432P6V0_9HYPH|nr:hypothetical protein [Rhizobium chutanense]RUM08443.1 hypothetical protein EFR84_06565 [Rhizobium chutanense]